MACKECENIDQYNCGCNESEHCNCSLQLSTICILYEGVKLRLLDTYDGENLESILKKVEEKFQEIFDLVQSQTYKNVGNGAEIFKKINYQGQVEFRTIASSNSVMVSENMNDIGLSVDPSWLYDFIINADAETTTTITDTIVGNKIAAYTNEDGIVSNIFENITSIVDNNNGSFTFTNEQKIPFTYNVKSIISSVSITNTQLGRRIATFTDADSNTTDINETVTSLIKTGDNGFTFTSEDGNITSYIPADADTSKKGIVQRANASEVSQGQDVNKYVTPADLVQATQAGLEVATQLEANTLIAIDKIITPGRIPKATTTQEGIVRFATPAEVEAGNVSNLVVSPSTLANSSLSIFSKYFEYDFNSWSQYSSLTISHGLGGTPKFIKVFMVAKTTANGYTAGEEIDVSNVNIVRPDTPQWYGLRLSSTSTNINVRVGLSIMVTVDPNASRAFFSNSNEFSIRVKAFI